MFVLLTFLTSCTQQNNFSKLSGPYLDQTPPGMTPELFAPEIISTGFRENCATFTAGGIETLKPEELK